MGAQKASWQAALLGESAALSGKSHAQILLDLIKAFERNVLDHRVAPGLAIDEEVGLAVDAVARRACVQQG